MIREPTVSAASLHVLLLPTEARDALHRQNVLNIQRQAAKAAAERMRRLTGIRRARKMEAVNAGR